MHKASFNPGPPLVAGVAPGTCRAVIIVPARDEESHLTPCLDALAAQLDEAGNPVPHPSFEIILLLNNCRDYSARVARAWQQLHPEISLHIVEQRFPADAANVGTARRLLMDTAWHRLSSAPPGEGSILSTDADTVVHPKWLCRNLTALQHGADAVGGLIQLHSNSSRALPLTVHHAYQRDREYQRLVARLEDLIDPQAGDPCPRHLDHFGASLACTRESYALAGGLPPVSCLEDVAFVDALRRIDARIRHEPSVMVFTSPRLTGRTEMGFSSQLRLWQDMNSNTLEQSVLSGSYLLHRFTVLAHLRNVFCHRNDLSAVPTSWHERLRDEVRRHTYMGQFLGAVDCDALIEESFKGERESPILPAMEELKALIASHSLTMKNTLETPMELVASR